MLYLLHNRKSSQCIRELFLVNTRGGTVLTLMPVGTGSWRHNRVAGAGIEPASWGYGPHEVPLLYPAMYLDYLKLKKFAHLPPRLDYQLSSTQICNYYTRLKKLCNLNYLKLAEDCLVAGDCSARERLCEFKRRASVCYLVAHLVRLPCFLQRT